MLARSFGLQKSLQTFLPERGSPPLHLHPLPYHCPATNATCDRLDPYWDISTDEAALHGDATHDQHSSIISCSYRTEGLELFKVFEKRFLSDHFKISHVTLLSHLPQLLQSFSSYIYFNLHVFSCN
jgi:hypothetical protein